MWNRGEKLYLAVEALAAEGDSWQLTPWAVLPRLDSWTLAVPEGTPLKVHAYSRYPDIRLLLNDDVVDETQTVMANGFHAELNVPYYTGDLVLEGISKGTVVGVRS